MAHGSPATWLVKYLHVNVAAERPKKQPRRLRGIPGFVRWACFAACKPEQSNRGRPAKTDFTVPLRTSAAGEMRTAPVGRSTLRSKIMEHLEAALALADETKDGPVLTECAMDYVHADMLPGNLDLPARRR